LLDLGEVEVLIDGGDRSPGVMAYLEDYVDGSLEAMIATHPHADHIGGLIAVLDVFEVERIWHNGHVYDSNTYWDFMGKVNTEGAEVREARRGDSIIVDGMTFDVLHPVEPLVGNTNNNSIVLMLRYGEIDFLFTGDAEHEAEASILAQSVIPLTEVEILKVGHHGSRTASSQALLDTIRPEVAIYMAGVGNRYGHPHAETISALQDIGAEIYGTDTHGTVLVETDGRDYTVITISAPVFVPTATPTAIPTATPTPSPTPTSTPTPTPSPRPTPTLTPSTDLALQIASVTSPIGKGYTATLRAKTELGAYCTITVYYKSGPSKASGLYGKQADSEGNVSWSWKVGTRTTPGSWAIVVTASLSGRTASETTYFTVY